MLDIIEFISIRGRLPHLMASGGLLYQDATKKWGVGDVWMLEDSDNVTEPRYAVLLIMTHFATMLIFHVTLLAFAAS